MSVVLTAESVHPDLMKKGSEMFFNKTSWIEIQVCSSSFEHQWCPFSLKNITLEESESFACPFLVGKERQYKVGSIFTRLTPPFCGPNLSHLHFNPSLPALRTTEFTQEDNVNAAFGTKRLSLVLSIVLCCRSKVSMKKILS